MRKMELFYSPIGSKLLFYSDLYCLVFLNLISNLYLSYWRQVDSVSEDLKSEVLITELKIVLFIFLHVRFCFLCKQTNMFLLWGTYLKWQNHGVSINDPAIVTDWDRDELTSPGVTVGTGQHDVKPLLHIPHTLGPKTLLLLWKNHFSKITLNLKNLS